MSSTPQSAYFCSRMVPFGDLEFRSRLHATLGPGGTSARKVLLHVESRSSNENIDLRAPCVRSMRKCTGAIVLLDGTSTLQGLNAGDAPVLELEVMYAALSRLPTVVVDASNGQDRLFDLLGSSFFGSRERATVSIVPIRAASRSQLISAAVDAIGESCDRDLRPLPSFDAASGWRSLFLARPDRSSAFSEDGGNFPFSVSRLDVGDFSAAHIDACLARAAGLNGTQKLDSLIAVWDAVRALSRSPWGLESEREHRLRWLRAMLMWGNLTHWLGLVGHSSAAAIMSALSGLHLASITDSIDTLDGSELSAVGFYNRLASAYYTVSRMVPGFPESTELRRLGIFYASEGLKQTRALRLQASLLGIRASLFSGIDSSRAVSDATECVAKHLKASGGTTADEGYAHGLIRLGVVVSNCVGDTHSPSTKRQALDHLKEGCSILDGLAASGQAIDLGQLVMGLKASARSLIDISLDDEARSCLDRALELATRIDALDQIRQLRSLQDELSANRDVPARGL